MKALIKEFKEFISRGNVMDMAVGVIIGGAFTAIVNSLVNDMLMPLLSLLTGGFDRTQHCPWRRRECSNDQLWFLYFCHH